MAKTRKVDGKAEKQTKDKIDRVFIKQDITLHLSKKFIYLVEWYKYTPRTFNLEDSKYVSSEEYISDKAEIITHSHATFKKVVHLRGAPLDWLIEHKFVELC